ncbi:MAG: NAD(P)-dependent oxidoreductase, partial [Pseudomonadota bacterium]
MKLAYLMKDETDLETVAPPGSDYVRISMRPDRTWDPKDLELLRDREAILTWKDLVTEEVIRAAPNLKIVQRFGAGYDVLEGCLEITRERGIYCCNLEGVNKESVGEHGIMLILAVARHLITMHDHVKNARWPRTLTPDNPTFELIGKTLGIVGLGNTGSELAKRAKAFEMKILYNDVREIDSEMVGNLDAVFAEK